jgi:hypothetical protein
MSKPLTINGTTYNYPDPGESPNWGDDSTGWAEAVTDALGTLLGAGDILQTTFSITNNITVADNINGLLFDPGVTRAANIDYSIYRISSTNTSGYAETGTIYIIYDTSAPVNNKWQLSQRTTGNSGVTFSITDSGQVQYKSNDIGVSGYSGTMKFRAKSLSI